MTFFPLQKRSFSLNQPSNTQIGPGSYSHHIPDTTSNKPSYAPFGSLIKKHRQTKSVSLGPGSYNIAENFIKPSITKYQNKNIIVIKINDEGGSQFISKSKRFQEISETNIPGPGSYLRESPSKKQSKSQYFRNELVNKVKVINRSIYESRRQPTLMSDPVQVQENKSFENNTDKKSKSVLNWSLNRKERFDALLKEQFSEENKSIAVSQAKRYKDKPKINHPSAVFASKSLKSHFEAQIYKTNNPFKAELRKMINFKDENPGPGHYLQDLYTSKNKQQRFQFFGSTVQRFPTDQSSELLVGPGSYEIQNKTDVKPTRERYDFEIKDDRYSYLPKNEEIPGPGAYEYDGPDNEGKQSELFPFGSKKPRFIEHQENHISPKKEIFEVNQQFMEKQHRKEEQIKQRKMLLNQHHHPCFASNSKRFQKGNYYSNPDTVYDVTQKDISSKLQKCQKTLKQLEDCQLYRPPFQSSIQRFSVQKEQVIVHKDCWCLSKSVEKQIIEHSSPAFASNEKKSIVFEVKSNNPSVGQYNQPKSYIKASFNSRFKKQNQNMMKKGVILKIQSKKKDQQKIGNEIIIRQ